MDRPHIAKQNHELHDPRWPGAKYRQLRFNKGYGLSSQQSGRRNGDIRIAEIMMEVEMKIRGLLMDPVTNMPIVILKDVTSDMVLPIRIGNYEANDKTTE